MGNGAVEKENRAATVRRTPEAAGVKKTKAKVKKPKLQKAKSIQIKVPVKPERAKESLDGEHWGRLLGFKWFDALKETLASSRMQSCLAYVEQERAEKTIYPPPDLMYSAFLKTPLDLVRVVIVGQDPYHQPGQAMGLSFSVPKGVKVPPSLRNIFRELKFHPSLSNGDLSHWADQGVFLLNSLLTVEEGNPMAHKDSGWADFTDKVIDVINTHRDRVIFMLWGNAAKKKAQNVDRNKHFVLEGAHPSPLSARFFQGCDHFKKANDKLKEWGEPEIDWSLA